MRRHWICRNSLKLCFILTVFAGLLVSACDVVLRPTFTYISAAPFGGGLFGDILAAPEAAGGDGAPAAAVAREVVEPDVVRLDGDILYILNQFRGLSIVDLSGASPRMMSTAPVYGFPRDMYVRDDRVYVLVSNAYTYTQEGDTLDFEIHSQLYVVDVSSLDQPEIVGRFNLEGDLVDSRLVGDVLYAVTRKYPNFFGPVVGGGGGVPEETTVDPPPPPDMEEPVPGDEGGGGGSDPADVPPDDPDSGDPDTTTPGDDGTVDGTDTFDTGETVVTSVNVSDPSNIEIVDEVRFDGTGQIIHATSNAIYVVGTIWDFFDGFTESSIQYVDISDPAGAITVRDTVTVRGFIEDRFKLDEYEDVLRVVSLSWEDFRKVFITTIDVSVPDELVVMAETELNRARGESLFATRFDGPRGYIVTFFVTDPLFVIDFSDPSDPQVLGELEVPGWSTHIEPFGDRLIALGVDDTDGRQVSVSIFDVSDPANPALSDRVSFGEDWVWSSAFSDVKAFTVLDEEGLILVPFSGFSSEAGAGFDRLQLVEFTLDDLTLRGAVDVQGDIRRSLSHAPDLLAVTTEQLLVIDPADLDAPVVVDTLQLAENVIDFVPLTGELGAQIVADHDSGMTLVQTLALPLNGSGTIGEAAVDIGFPRASFGSGTTVILVGVSYDPETYSGSYRVAAVDCSNPSRPSVSSELTVDLEPFYGFFLPFADVGIAADIAVAPGFGCFGCGFDQTVFQVGDALVMRVWLSDTDPTDFTFGTDVQFQQGLALVDIGNPNSLRLASTIRLAYDGIASVNAPGNGFVYLTTVTNAGETLGGFPVVAYFVAELDVGDPDNPVLGSEANVPGVFVKYNRGAEVLTLQDQQWTFEGQVTSSLRTVSWQGGDSAAPLDDRELPVGTGFLLPTESHVFFERYLWQVEETGVELWGATVDNSGQIGLSGDNAIKVTPQFANLLGATGNHALMQVGGGAVARYDFSGTSGSLGDYFQVTGYPFKIVFSDSNTAYLPQGYFGLEEISLE